MKKRYTHPLIAFVIAITICGAAAACNQSGTTLSAGVTANPHYQIEYKWTIDKTATPDTFNLSKTDTGTTQYTVSVTKDAGTKTAWIEGYVTVTNGGSVATENLAVNVKLTMSPSQSVIASAYVDTSAHPVLAPGETWTYPYKISIPADYINPANTYKVTSDVTITNYSGHPGTPFGPSPSDTTNLPEPTLINDKIHVTDSNGESWTFSNSGSETYTRTFSYKGNPTDVYKNTATIQETEQSADATVTVNWKSSDDPPVDPLSDPLSDPPSDPPVDPPSDPINITIGDNASILVPTQNQIQNQAQAQSQTSINTNTNTLTNVNTNNITNNNTFDPLVVLNNLNKIGNIAILSANINKQILTIKRAKIIKKHKRHHR